MFQQRKNSRQSLPWRQSKVIVWVVVHHCRAQQGTAGLVWGGVWVVMVWWRHSKGPSTLATLFSHRWPRIVAGIFIPVGNHYFQALASTLQFVAQVCHRLWLVPATDRAFAYTTYMSPPHVAATCRPSVSATMRGHMWLHKVASVLGP